MTQTLSRPTLAYLGRLSYGTYLWHWPVIVVLTREVSLGSVGVFAITCLLATALAAVSYHVLELRDPLLAMARRLPEAGHRRGTGAQLDRRTRPDSRHPPHRHGSTARHWTGSPRKNDIPALPDCSSANTAGCTIVHGAGKHILLLGDSNARMYIPTFQKIATTEGLTLSVAAGPLCPWQRGSLLPDRRSRTVSRSTRTGTAAWWTRSIPMWSSLVDRPDRRHGQRAARDLSAVRPFQPGDDGFERGSDRRVGRRASPSSKATGRKLVIIEPIPIAAKDADPINCLSSTSNVDNCIYQANSHRTPLENFYRAAAAQGSVWSSVDLDRADLPAAADLRSGRRRPHRETRLEPHHRHLRGRTSPTRSTRSFDQDGVLP